MLHKFLTVRKLERFIALATLPVLLIGSATLISGLYFSLFSSPPDYQQGDTVRIMYIHVPSAWMSLFIYSLIAAFSFGYLVWKNPLCYLIAKAAAPIGLYFTGICLITGSIWGYPTWGTWWVWDARLTSVLILFFIYLGYMGLSEAFNTEEREARSASVLALVGIINIPIIKYSVEWWNTLHQPASVFKVGGPSIDGSMLLPLLLMAAAWMCIFAMVLFFNVKTALYKKKMERVR